MLRMYLMQIWFNLSDEGIEDSIYDSYAMRTFMHIDFNEQQQWNDCGCEPDCCTKVYKEQNSETSKLIRKDDHVVYGDSGYLGAPECPEIINDETLSQVEFRIIKPHENIQSTSFSFFICR